MSIALLPTLSVACGGNALLSLALVPILHVVCDDNVVARTVADIVCRM